MNLNRITYLILLFIGLQSVTLAQVDSTQIDSVVIDSTLFQPVLLSQESPGQQQQDELQDFFKVVPWEFHAPIDAELLATDSTLRWQYWPDWTYKLNRVPGVISYRLGTGIRSNAVQIGAHEPRHQQLYWEGVSMNDPVSGMVNWALIPHRKVNDMYQRDLGTVHRSTFYLRQYYLNKPLSRLSYSESKFSHRNLEFEVSHNLSQRTNVELSYWDRRTGGGFPNSQITGRQIFGKISHHLDERRYLKLNYLNNTYDIGQPFGYNIPDLLNYNFDRFTTNANEPSASSDETHNLMMLNYYQRSSDTTKAVDNLHAGIYYRGLERSVTYPVDSTRYKLQSVGANAKKWWSFGGLTLEGSATAEHFFNQSGSEGSLQTSDWSLIKTEGYLSLDYTPLIDLKGGSAFRLRSDGFQSYRINASSDIEIGDITITAAASSGSIMPTPQQLYWNSEEFTGSSSLRNEKIQEVRGSLSYQFNSGPNVGIRGQVKDVTDGIMVVDTVFSNVNSYASQSATAFFGWDLEHFEFDGSATVHKFADSYTSPTGTIPMEGTERVWLKGGAYWKGYLFDRATYVKAGLSGMLSPFRYQADHYNPVLDYWQPVSDDQQLPYFSRLDVDISARVRSIIFTLRWENVLDDVSQLGYFETAQYPMANRRFIFGVRALFRN